MVEVVWVFLPVLGAAVAHAPVLKFDLFQAIKKPVDFGLTARGHRLFGENKTWRGIVSMFVGVLVATVLLARWPWWWSRLPPELQAAGPWKYGALLGLGTAFAELPNSFAKRQLGIAPGTQQRSLLGVVLAIYDQGDFVAGIWIALLPLWRMQLVEAAFAFLVVVAVHMVINVLGKLIGARKTWI